MTSCCIKYAKNYDYPVCSWPTMDFKQLITLLVWIIQSKCSFKAVLLYINNTRDLSSESCLSYFISYSHDQFVSPTPGWGLREQCWLLQSDPAYLAMRKSESRVRNEQLVARWFCTSSHTSSSWRVVNNLSVFIQLHLLSTINQPLIFYSLNSCCQQNTFM